MIENESNSEGLMERQTTGEDRVRMTARQLSEPRTTNWIASEADWSHEPTKRVLERLVDDGILHRDGSGTHTTYYPDYRRQAMQEAMRLRDSGHTVEELTSRLADMKTQIRNWEDEYDVESPNHLRGRSLTSLLTLTRKTVAVRLPVSGSIFSSVSRSSASPSANGTSSLRRQSLRRLTANGCRSRIQVLIRTRTSMLS